MDPEGALAKQGRLGIGVFQYQPRSGFSEFNIPTLHEPHTITNRLRQNYTTSFVDLASPAIIVWQKALRLPLKPGRAGASSSTCPRVCWLLAGGEAVEEAGSASGDQIFLAAATGGVCRNPGDTAAVAVVVADLSSTFAA